MRLTVLKSRVSHKGGLERYAISIAKAFAQKGVQTTLLTTGKTIEVPGVTVTSLGPHPKTNLQAISEFDKLTKEWLRNNPQDFVFGLDRNEEQTHYRAGNGLHATFLKQKYKIPLMRAFYRLNPKHRLILKKEKQLFLDPGLKKLFTNSKMVKQDLIRTYQVPDKIIEVVHNGVDFEYYKLSKAPPSETKKTSLLFIGNNYQRKGLDLIFKALSDLKNFSFHLDVVGHDKNIRRYQKEAQKLNMSDSITFWGPQKDLRPFYQKADLFLLPTLYDPFANVTVEALAMGLFVITSKYNGGSEVLNPDTGIVLENLNDVDAFKKALMQGAAMPQELSTKQLRRFSIQHLDINAQMNKIVDLTINTAS